VVQVDFSRFSQVFRGGPRQPWTLNEHQKGQVGFARGQAIQASGNLSLGRTIETVKRTVTKAVSMRYNTSRAGKKRLSQDNYGSRHRRKTLEGTANEKFYDPPISFGCTGNHGVA